MPSDVSNMVKESEDMMNKTKGTGTYQVGDAPKSLAQKVQDNMALRRLKASTFSKQKIKSYAPGSDPSIKGKTSFSDGSVQ